MQGPKKKPKKESSLAVSGTWSLGQLVEFCVWQNLQYHGFNSLKAIVAASLRANTIYNITLEDDSFGETSMSSSYMLNGFFWVQEYWRRIY
jgi:hypothetical protein